MKVRRLELGEPHARQEASRALTPHQLTRPASQGKRGKGGRLAIPNPIGRNRKRPTASTRWLTPPPPLTHTHTHTHTPSPVVVHSSEWRGAEVEDIDVESVLYCVVEFDDAGRSTEKPRAQNRASIIRTHSMQPQSRTQLVRQPLMSKFQSVLKKNLMCSD